MQRNIPAWARTIGMLWYFPLVHYLLPALMPIAQRRTWLPLPLRLVGAMLFWGGTGLTASSMLYLVRDGAGTPAPHDPPRKLVLRGPYSHCRNPMELGNLLSLAGRGLLAGDAQLGAAALSFGIGHHFWFVLIEEPGLLRRFGPEYAQYQAQVPRWAWRIRQKGQLVREERVGPSSNNPI